MDFSKAAKYSKLVAPHVKVIFHGCSVLNYREGLGNLLKSFGSEAEIFAHPVSGEAGRPYEFYKVTLPEGEEKIKSELLPKVTIILPKSYIIRWASEQKTERLYGLLLLKEINITDDAKEAIIEVLKERLKKEVKKWGIIKLERKLKSELRDWEKAIITEEIKNRETIQKNIQ